MSAAAGIADWVASSPLIDGVLFGSSDGQVEGPPVCAVAVLRGFRGFGKGVTQSEALVSAVGEALEQYAASQVRYDRLRRATFHEIAGQAFDPDWLCLYGDSQYQRPDFPYRPFDPDRPLHWTPGYWLDSGEPIFMPAFATYLNSAFDEEAVCQVTSNGLAAGESLEDATRRAVLELYERDAFLVSWISLRPGLAVALEDIDPRIAEIARHVEGRGAKLEVYLLARGDPAFVAVCAGLGDGRDWPAVTLGLGAGGSMRNAVNKAILEHGQTGPFFARIWRNRELPIPATAEAIRTLQDHALYYCDPDHAQQFHRWRNSVSNRTPIAWDTNQECSTTRFNVRIAIADLTPPDVANCPFHVVRAIARGLQPIYYGHGFERTYTPRLQALLKGRESNVEPPPIC